MTPTPPRKPPPSSKPAAPKRAVPKRAAPAATAAEADVPVKLRRVSLKGQNTRERVLARSAELFAQHGYDSLGLQDLAAACGLSKGALFAHFDTKRQIYVESVARVFSLALDPYELPPPTESVRKRLRHYLQWICLTMSSNPLLPKLILRIVLDNDVELARDIVPGSFNRTHTMLRNLLREVKPKKDPDVLHFYLYSILTLNDELYRFFAAPTGIGTKGQRLKAGCTPDDLEALVMAW